jgi:hypothetical protein
MAFKRGVKWYKIGVNYRRFRPKGRKIYRKKPF